MALVTGEHVGGDGGINGDVVVLSGADHSSPAVSSPNTTAPYTRTTTATFFDGCQVTVRGTTNKHMHDFQKIRQHAAVESAAGVRLGAPVAGDLVVLRAAGETSTPPTRRRQSRGGRRIRSSRVAAGVDAAPTKSPQPRTGATITLRDARVLDVVPASANGGQALLLVRRPCMCVCVCVRARARVFVCMCVCPYRYGVRARP